MTLISEGCTLIVWKRSDLMRVLRQQPHIKNIFDSIIGQDVAFKLFKSVKVLDGSNKKESLESVMYGVPSTPQQRSKGIEK